LGHLGFDGGCSASEVQVGDIRTSIGGLWISLDFVFAVSVEGIAKRLLQCFRCLELGYMRATCVSTVDQEHLCYRYGGSDYRVKDCPASVPKYSVFCDSHGAPAAHRMGGTPCVLPKTKRKRPTRELAAKNR
jgi:hypothetical protein